MLILTTFQLKSDYKEVHELREMSGFGWDDATQRVTAENDVWEALKEVCLHYFESILSKLMII